MVLMAFLIEMSLVNMFKYAFTRLANVLKSSKICKMSCVYLMQKLSNLKG